VHQWFLDWYRRSDIVACVGQGAWENETLEDTRQLDRLFHEKRIPAWVDFWGTDVDHDWPWWHQQMCYFLDYLYRRDS
jgi:esterase/lipase superfamily enzyme